MTENETTAKIAADLRRLGIQFGDLILVHSSLSALGVVPGVAETVVRGLLQAIGKSGTLLMPALSYEQKPHHLHNTRLTPSNVGAIPEHFRLREGTLRSVHPTHSVCGVGPAAAELLREHIKDHTPCGPHSPFNRMIAWGAKIVMLGCGLLPNTTMHALEEYIVPPYLFGEDCFYTITDGDGVTFTKTYTTHNFRGWKQRYDRVAELPDTRFLHRGMVLNAVTYIMDANGLKNAVLQKMREDCLFFGLNSPGDGTRRLGIRPRSIVNCP